VYFVIPEDKSHGPPVEVVELFGMPIVTDEKRIAGPSASSPTPQA
jgi:hypothetical protein